MSLRLFQATIGASRRLAGALVVASAFLLAGCSASSPTGGGPRTYSLPSPPHPGPNDAWIVSPQRAEELLGTEDLKIIGSKDAGAGVTGASRFELESTKDG